MNPVEAPAKPKVEFVVAEAIEPPFRVLIHNDDVTPMDFVVAVLRAMFELAIERAEAVMLTAHYTGGALVGTWGALRRSGASARRTGSLASTVILSSLRWSLKPR